MNFRLVKTRTRAFVLLFFANFILTAAAVSAQTEASIYQLQAGTVMRVSMDNEINSRVASVNDTFTMTLAAPVTLREAVLLPIGTVIEGRVTKVRRAAFGGRGGSLEVSFQTLRLANGARREIEGVLVNELPSESSAATANVLTVVGGTTIGAIIGAVSKAETGAAIGAGLGAGAGTGIAFLRKGKNVGIKADEKFEIKLTKNVVLPVPDF